MGLESKYEERYYREFVDENDLVNTNLVELESDLQIYTRQCLSEKHRSLLRRIRGDISDYIKKHPEFIKSLIPIDVLPGDPEIVRHMKVASKAAGVGPMAAIAGAVNQYFASAVEEDEIIIENGGDLYIRSQRPRKVLIHAGESVLSDRFSLIIEDNEEGVGICTSSGKYGHSLSFGKSDAVVVVSKDTLLADSAATSLGNLVHSTEDIQKAIEFGRTIEGIDGIVIICDDAMGAWGSMKIVE